MSAKDAADAYRRFMNPFAGKAYLEAPAVTNSPPGMKWLKEFLSLCTGCHIDFVPIHWYDSATNIEYFKNYLTDAHDIAGHDLWTTEVRIRDCVSFGTDNADTSSSTDLAHHLKRNPFSVLSSRGLTPGRTSHGKLLLVLVRREVHIGCHCRQEGESDDFGESVWLLDILRLLAARRTECRRRVCKSSDFCLFTNAGTLSNEAYRRIHGSTY